MYTRRTERAESWVGFIYKCGFFAVWLRKVRGISTGYGFGFTGLREDFFTRKMFTVQVLVLCDTRLVAVLVPVWTFGVFNTGTNFLP